jgi:hypothetical protein
MRIVSLMYRHYKIVEEDFKPSPTKRRSFLLFPLAMRERGLGGEGKISIFRWNALSLFSVSKFRITLDYRRGDLP